MALKAGLMVMASFLEMPQPHYNALLLGCRVNQYNLQRPLILNKYSNLQINQAVHLQHCTSSKSYIQYTINWSFWSTIYIWYIGQICNLQPNPPPQKKIFSTQYLRSFITPQYCTIPRNYTTSLHYKITQLHFTIIHYDNTTILQNKLGLSWAKLR